MLDRASDKQGSLTLPAEMFGYRLLADPRLNKGTAFTEDERTAFLLHGLLPPTVVSIDDQVNRRLHAFREFHTDLERYAFLRDLQDTNETLYYALLGRHVEELLPIVYTPTVGAGCASFSRLFRKPRGVFLSIPHRKQIRQILSNPEFDKTEVIVVTDGEPSDVDIEDRQYLVEDARKAVHHLNRLGIDTFCVGLESEADSYLGRIFGQRNAISIGAVEKLTELLPRLYLTLSR